MDRNACFFSLLRAGLWGTEPDEALFREKNVDWDGIINLAISQTVPGIVFDGVEKLPEELRPPRACFMKWFALVVKIEQANERLNHVLAEIGRKYGENDIRFILLKGQGCASMYLRPEHRQCGDLDLYTGRKDFERANELMDRLGTRPDSETDKHIGYTYKEVEIEIHRYAACFSSPLLNRKLQRFAGQWLDAPGCVFNVNGVGVKLPDPGFNAIYLLLHALLHFIQEGIGLRQVCDWVRLLSVYSKEIDRSRLIREIKILKLEQAFHAFGYIAVSCLGLPACCLPLPVDDESGKSLLSDILKGGNFGRGHGKNEKRPGTRWGGKLYSFLYICNRCRMMSRFHPSEARWYPYFRVKNLYYRILPEKA